MMNAGSLERTDIYCDGCGHEFLWGETMLLVKTPHGDMVDTFCEDCLSPDQAEMFSKPEEFDIPEEKSWKTFSVMVEGRPCRVDLDTILCDLLAVKHAQKPRSHGADKVISGLLKEWTEGEIRSHNDRKTGAEALLIKGVENVCRRNIICEIADVNLFRQFDSYEGFNGLPK